MKTLPGKIDLFVTSLKLASVKNFLFIRRCSTPYELTSDLLVDITIDKLCLVSNNKKPRQPVYDPPPFLRPRSILFSLLSILIVVLIGLCIGFAIVLIKKKLKQNEVGFASPIRYTTVRNSTVSVG